MVVAAMEEHDLAMARQPTGLPRDSANQQAHGGRGLLIHDLLSELA